MMRRFNSSNSLNLTPAKMVVHSSVMPRSHRKWSPAKLVTGAFLLAFIVYIAHLLLRPFAPLTYGLMIDAGSTGSRMHTFAFRRTATGELKLSSEDFLAIKPGLSAHKDDPRAAAMSLDPLLARARRLVPESQRAETPVFLRATAGLRMAGHEKSEAILAAVRKHLGSSGFRFSSPSGASILGGSDEGVYSWITVNYLMNRKGTDTVGTLEMGGGSSQVAFVPTTTPHGSRCDARTQTQLYGGEHLPLFTRSDLGFGLQKARAVALSSFEATGNLVRNPCINAGGKVDVKIPFDTAGKSVSLAGSGNFGDCRAALEKAVIEPARNACVCAACDYSGTPRPEPISEYVAIAFYRERTFGIGMPRNITVGDIVAKGVDVCSMSVVEVLDKFPKVSTGAATDLCLDLAYIVTHLKHGYGITENSGTVLHVKDRISGYELGWSLGAMFHEMSKLGQLK